MAHPKIIIRSAMKVSNTLRRKAKRASRCWNSAIIIFQNLDDNYAQHFRTKNTYENTNGRSLNTVRYFNNVDTDSQSFKKPNHWLPSLSNSEHVRVRKVSPKIEVF